MVDSNYFQTFQPSMSLPPKQIPQRHDRGSEEESDSGDDEAPPPPIAPRPDHTKSVQNVVIFYCMCNFMVLM